MMTPERPSVPPISARHVVARHVLHDLAAEAQHARRAPLSMIRRRGRSRARDPAAARRGPDSPVATAPPTVASAPKCGGSNGSIWPASARIALELGERRAGARRDPRARSARSSTMPRCARVSSSAPTTGLAVEILAAAAADAQRCVAPRKLRARTLLDETRAVSRLEIEVASHQKRSSSGKGSAPRCDVHRPNSAQRCSVGTALPGLSRPSRVERAP